MKRVKVCEMSAAHTPAQIPCGLSPSTVPQPGVTHGSQTHRGSGAQQMPPGQGGGNLDGGEMLLFQTSHQELSCQLVMKGPAGGGVERAKAAGSTQPPWPS